MLDVPHPSTHIAGTVRPPPTLVLLLALSSCALAISEREMMEHWVGRPANELLIRWGLPTRTESDASGGRVLVSEKTVTFGTDTPATVTGLAEALAPNAPLGAAVTITPARPAPKSTYYRMFFVDARGVIYAWRSNS